MHNFTFKILFTITFVAGFALTVFGDVVPDEKMPNEGKVKSNSNYVGVCTGDNVRIRTMPSTKSAIITNRTMKGDHYEILGSQGNWYEIRLPEYVAVWISRKYVDAVAGNPEGTVTGNDVNLRTANSTNSTKVGKVSKGDKVEIVGANGDWFLILPPIQATGWISGQYFKQIGPASEHNGLLVEARNKYLKRAASYYTSKGETKLADAYRKMIGYIPKQPPVDDPVDPLEKARELETAKYQTLLMRYNQLDMEKESAKVEVLEAFAQELLVFANSCKTEIKDKAMSLYNELNTKISEINAYKKKIDADAEAKEIANSIIEKRKQMLREVDIRLMRKDADKYVAKGVVVDKQLASGMTIYFLAIGNVEKYRLVTINTNENLRDYWRKEIGIIGKIVYDEDEDYPVILCEKIESLDKK